MLPEQLRLESYGNPLPGKVGTPTLLIHGLQLDLTRLIVGRWFLSRPVTCPC